MALGRDVVDAIIREHTYRPITGDVVVVGPPTLALSRDEVLELMHEHGVAPAPDGGGGSGLGTMSADALFALLGVDNLHKIEADDGAADATGLLRQPSQDWRQGSADVIIDGGTLTDLFAPSDVLRSYGSTLRPGGRLLAINNLSAHFDPYTIPTASWYLDYFVSNGFADCKAYVLVYPPGKPTNAFCLDTDCLSDPAREIRTFLSPHEMAVIVFAEKGPASTTQLTPDHPRLRSPQAWRRFRRNLAAIKRSQRPHLVRSRGAQSESDVRGGHLFMRTDYTAVEPSPPEPPPGVMPGASIGAPVSPSVQTPAAAQTPRSRLKVLCVGTGRDGTQSLNAMIEHIFGGSGQRRSEHEYCCREFYRAFCRLKETGDDSHADAIRQMIDGCPYDSIVGNGYAAILPEFAERYGRGLKVVHLYRNREACIDSLITNCELFPTAYRYYSTSPEAKIERMAAFHFGELARDVWDRLPLREKFAWYYDKTHELVGQHLALFDDHIAIATEGLNDEATRRRIADFVGGHDAAAPPRTHLNASVIDISSFARQHQVKMNWLMGRLNLGELAKDDVYALDYFLDKFVAWTGYQIANAQQLGGTQPASAAEIAADLERADRVLNERLRQIAELYELVRGRRDADPK